MKPRLADLFCKAGGAGMGYHRAGFEVVGVDIEPQPNYPFQFIQMDALAVLDMIRIGTWNFAAIHASCPCQFTSKTQRIQGNEHPDLIGATRGLLEAIGLPYVIENVPDAPLRDPVELCGTMFGLGTYRHRLFETNFPLAQPVHPEHHVAQRKMGRAPDVADYMHVVGNFSGVEQGRAAMGIHWMNRNELAEAIPPAYSEYVGRQLMDHLNSEELAA